MPADRRPTTWKAAILGLILFFGSDALLFRTGLYAWIAKPESSAGWVERRTRLDDALAVPAPLQIAVLGDSRAGEGFWPQLFDDSWPGDEVGLRGLWIPGSTPRVWSYLLETVDPDGGRFPLLVVPLSSYDDHDESEDMADRVYDLAFLGSIVGLADGFDLAFSFGPEHRCEAFSVVLCKWYAWRRDLRDLLGAPRQRWRDVRRQWVGYRDAPSYPGEPGTLAGVHLDGERLVGLPAGTDEQVARELRVQALGALPAQTGRRRSYRERWLGRIVAHQAGSGTRVVFLRMPTRVLPRREPWPSSQGVLDELARQSHVHVLDRDLFADLERPEYFFDALHLNGRGREALTRRLADVLRERFGERLER